MNTMDFVEFMFSEHAVPPVNELHPVALETGTLEISWIVPNANNEHETGPLPAGWLHVTEGICGDVTVYAPVPVSVSEMSYCANWLIVREVDSLVF